ncbi:MAG: adenylate/guanylate cyclase domain-containing protein [Acidobacteriota bacterium]
MTVRKFSMALAVGAAAAALALAVGYVPLVDTLEWKLYDQRVRWSANPSKAHQDIVMVTIDENSVRVLEPFIGRWPWPRLVHANVIDFLAEAGAKAVVFDVLFTERDSRTGFDVGGTIWSGKESDGIFAESVKKAGNVVVLADATFEGRVGEAAPVATTPFEARPDLRLPYDELAKAARMIGHNYFVLDPDGPVRRAVTFVDQGGRLVPSLSCAGWMVAASFDLASAKAGGRGVVVGGQDIPLVTDVLPSFDHSQPRQTARRLLIDFRGPAVLDDGVSTVYKTYSYYKVFAARDEQLAKTPPSLSPALFRDKIVVIGTTAAGLHDVFAVPFSTGGKMPGPQIHASVIDQLLSSRFIEPVPRVLGGALVVGLAIITALLIELLPLRWAIPGALLLLSGVVALSFQAFTRGSWWPLAQPGIGWMFAVGGGLGYQYFIEGRDKRAVKKLFSRYLSPDVYALVLENPALAELGGKRREMSVLFSDIRGFTSMTEAGKPEAVVEQLNEYFSAMVNVLFEHKGTLDKFVGDMVMALFGAPLNDDEHADHAVQAALAMQDKLKELNVGWTARGMPEIHTGVGVNSGDMIAGTIGSDQVRSYTVIGDAVNLGSRIESLNKNYGTTVLISEFTVARLKHQYDLRALGEVVVKGKSKAVAIFEVKPLGAGGANQPQEDRA